MRRDTVLPDLRWPRIEAIEDMCSGGSVKRGGNEVF